jgi:hypothetical protein
MKRPEAFRLAQDKGRRGVVMRKTVLHLFMLLMLTGPAIFAIDNLKLNSKLDYTSDSLDGRLITGDDAESGFVPGKPNYVIIYGEGCFNSKRQVWDANLYTSSQDAINRDFRGQLREEFNILTFVQDKLLTGASMEKPFGSAGFSINCPIVLRLD